MDFITIIGVVGAIVILVAFFLNETHRISDDDLIYDCLNLVGTLFLVIYAIELKSLPFLILNSIWFVVALRDIINFKKK